MSSVLNNQREFGKSGLIDGSRETCWSSDQGNNQFIQCQFKQPVFIESIGLTFQGGFVGHPCQYQVIEQGERSFKLIDSFDTKDINSAQIFACDVSKAVLAIKLVFEGSTDQFGRITVYDLSIRGKPVEAAQ